MKIESAFNPWDTHAPRTMADVAKIHEQEISEKDDEIEDLNNREYDMQDEIQSLEAEVEELGTKRKDDFDWRFEAALRRVAASLDQFSEDAIQINRAISDVFDN